MKDERAFDHDMEGKPPEFDLKTLSGDLRDAMLSRIRQMRTTWPLCTEAEQADIVNGLDMAARAMVKEVVRLLTGYDFPRAAVTLGEVKIKGEKGIEAKITCPNIEVYRSVLGEHVGDMVLLLMVDSDKFLADRATPDIQPDQADLFAAPPPEGIDDVETLHDADTGEVLPEAEPEPVAEPVIFDTNLLAWAIREAVGAQECSALHLCATMGISPGTATALISGMTFFGIVSAADAAGHHRVLCATVADAYSKAEIDGPADADDDAA